MISSLKNIQIKHKSMSNQNLIHKRFKILNKSKLKIKED